MQLRPFHIFQTLVILAVIAVIVTGFFVIGSPSQERARKLDQQRVNDLQQIQSAMDQYYNLSNRYQLPASLVAMQQERNVYLASVVDPKTAQPYEYRTTGDMSYQLCATFEMDAQNDPQNPYAPKAYPAAPIGPNFWSHTVGRNCYDLTVQRWPAPPKP